MSRLQLLNANADKSLLSTDEAKAVASHLMANVPQVGMIVCFLARCSLVDIVWRVSDRFCNSDY